MGWPTLSTMIFALGTVFGGLIIMLGIVLFKHNPSDQS